MSRTTLHRLVAATGLVASIVAAPLANAGPVAAPAPDPAASKPKVTSNKIGPQKPIVPSDKVTTNPAKKVISQ